MRFVIDHIAKPPIRGGDDRAWAAAMARAGGRANVYCKLSGMITEADWANWQPDTLAPYVRRIVGWFGVDRLMFGSDWPVCLLAAEYGDTLAVLGDDADVLAGTAIRTYGLEVA